VGNRPGHYRAFLSLLRNASSWETATKDYGRINGDSSARGTRSMQISGGCSSCDSPRFSKAGSIKISAVMLKVLYGTSSQLRQLRSYGCVTLPIVFLS
jgi:hypothetical protein